MALDDLVPWGWGQKQRSRTPAVREVPVSSLHREMNRLFDDFFSDFGLVDSGKGAAKFGDFSPRIDIVESDSEIKVTAELPGLDEKDLDLNLTKDALVLRGQKRYEHEEKEEGILYRERSFGSFERAIPLNVEIEHDRVEAKFKNGVVTVTLPKTKEAQRQARKISIKSA